MVRKDVDRKTRRQNMSGGKSTNLIKVISMGLEIKRGAFSSKSLTIRLREAIVSAPIVYLTVIVRDHKS